MRAKIAPLSEGTWKVFNWFLAVIGLLFALYGVWHIAASIRDLDLPERKWKRFAVWHGRKVARVYAFISGFLLVGFGLFVLMLGLFGDVGSPKQP